MDLAIRQASTTGVYTFLGTGTTTWLAEDVMYTTSTSRHVIVDVDADGEHDLVFHDGARVWALTSPAGVAFSQLVSLGSATFTANVPIGSADFNDDGAPDVAAAEHLFVSNP